MENIVEIIQEFWGMVPVVGLDALYVFLTVGLLKFVGVLGEDTEAKLGNLAVTFFVSGGTQLEAVPAAMTAVIAGVYYHVWKMVKPYLAKALNYILERVGINKLL
jgi:hypothetical protein